MPFSPDVIFLDPETIIINRENRQRKEIDTKDLLESIEENGVINPIIVRRENDTTILVAGERRLESCKKLKIPIPCRYFSSLNPIDIEKIELEENLKRKDLPWRDQVITIGKIHTLYLKENPQWTKLQTAKSLSITPSVFNNIIKIFQHLDSPYIKYAENISQAISIIDRFYQERVSQIDNLMKETFSKPTDIKTLPDYFEDRSKLLNISDFQLDFEDQKPKPVPPVLNQDFFKWIEIYNGNIFSFIHCDFPKKDFFRYLTAFINRKNIFHQNESTLMIWFDPEYYSETESLLNTYYHLVKPALIWYKSDLKVAFNVYETAFLCGEVHNLKPNLYASPSATMNSAPKSELMLKHFFSMIITSETTFLDPCCGLGHSLKIAEDLGAKSILGLEKDKSKVCEANGLINRARILRSSKSQI